MRFFHIKIKKQLRLCKLLIKITYNKSFKSFYHFQFIETQLIIKQIMVNLILSADVRCIIVIFKSISKVAHKVSAKLLVIS